jgi:hypothetical protein
MKQKQNKKAPVEGEIIIYKSPTGPKLEVHLEKDTVWLDAIKWLKFLV